MKPSAAALLMVVAISTIVSCGSPATSIEPTPSQTAAAAPSVRFPDGSAVMLEVVSDPMTRAQGLMFRSSLGSDRGMLFIFPEAMPHAFWMKNTLIPLDIIWIDEARTIVHIARDVPPCAAEPCPSYPPKAAATFVLELAAGQAAARGLHEGDTLVFEGTENFVAR